MPKKIAFLMVGAALLAGIVPLAVRASAEGSLALVSQVGLTVTVDQEILCTRHG